VRRDNGEKLPVSLDEIGEKAGELLQNVHDALYEKALASREGRIYDVTDYDTFCDTINNKPGFVRAMWCGDKECEQKIKDDTQATSRCMPFAQEQLSDKCVCCGRPAKKLVVWGKAY